MGLGFGFKSYTHWPLSGDEKVETLGKVILNLGTVQDEALSMIAFAEVVEDPKEIVETIKQAKTLVDNLDTHLDAARAVLKKGKAFIDAA